QHVEDRQRSENACHGSKLCRPAQMGLICLLCGWLGGKRSRPAGQILEHPWIGRYNRARVGHPEAAEAARCARRAGKAEAAMWASWCIAAGTNTDKRIPLAYLIAMIVLMVVVLAAGLLIIFVGKWTRRAQKRGLGEDGVSFRVLYERGELTEEEYQKIRA